MTIPSTEMRVLQSLEADADRFLLEGPREVIVDGRSALAWVNIQTGVDSTKGTIHLRFWDNGEHRALPQPARPGFLLPTQEANFVIAGCEKEVGLLDLRTNSWQPWATIPDANPRTIINDGEMVPGGRAIIFGTKDIRFAEPIAHLYLLTLDDHQITILADQQLCSNGKFFLHANGDLHLYDIDTPKRNMVRYQVDLAQRRIGEPRVILDLQNIEGFPDGMVDAGDDTAIIAFYNSHRGGAGRAVRFRLSSGEMVEEWTTPGSPRVTCPLLIQRDGTRQLVLTTAVEGMPNEMRPSSPNAGFLFIGPAINQ